MGLKQRISKALAGVSTKAAMTFSQYGGIGGFWFLDDNFRRSLSWPYVRNTQIDYRQEVGDLTQSSLVMSAVNWAGRTMPQAVFRVYDLKGDEPQPLPKHPLHWRMRRPNPHFSGARMWKASVLSWILSGNVYWFKARSGSKVNELWWLPHWMMQPRRDNTKDFVSYYEYRVDGVPFKLKPADVIHFRDGVDPIDDMVGISPVRSLLRTIFTDNEYEQYSALLAKNSGVPPFGIVPKSAPGVRVDVQKIKDELMRRVGGDERGKPTVFTSEVEVVKFGFTPEEMNLSMLRRVPEERLSGVLGIPAVVLGFGAGLERGTYENFRQAIEMAYEGFAIPLWEYFADELTAQLLPDFDGQPKAEEPTREVRADLSKVRPLQEDQDALHQRLDNSFQAGWMKRSEVRAKAGLPVDEAIDDVYYMDLLTMMAEVETANDPDAADPEPDESELDDTKTDELEPESDESEEIAPIPFSIKSVPTLPNEYSQKAEGEYEFSSVYVSLPLGLSGVTIAKGSLIPDDQLDAKGREDDPHVTILFGLHTKDPELVRAVLQNEPPPAVVFGRTDMFEGPEFDVLFVEVISPDLNRLNMKLKANLEYTNDNPEYIPHATVAYLKSGQARQYVGKAWLEGAAFIASLFCFSTADNLKTEIRFEGARKSVNEAKQIVDDVDTGTDESAREWWMRGAPDDTTEDDLAGLIQPEVVE